MGLSPQRQARAERLGDYFDLQLRFAHKVAEIGSIPLTGAVTWYTNFHRRFGLGRLQGNPSSAAWMRYIDQLCRFETHDQRVAFTQAFFLASSEEPTPANQRQFGCFTCEPPNPSGAIRLHFANRDHDGTGPLKRSKIETRKRELKEMFTFIQSTYPSATGVRGGSWLYHTEAYRRLFPPAYGASRVILKQSTRFDGTSSWGQFLDHREHIKPDVRDVFLQNLNQLDMDHLWRAFPLPALVTHAPIQAFYDFYDIKPHASTNTSS